MRGPCAPIHGLDDGAAEAPITLIQNDKLTGRDGPLRLVEVHH
jgi:hypothetical protein